MAAGTVKWFGDDKRFGFITPDDQRKDLFVQPSSIAGNGFKSLAEGAELSYDAEQGRPSIGMSGDTRPSARETAGVRPAAGRSTAWCAWVVAREPVPSL